MAKALSLFSRAVFVTLVALLPAVNARASGNVERLLQVMVTAKDPNVMVVRYGASGSKSNGLLFSNDGGRTFRAACSSLVAPGLKLHRSLSIYLSTVYLEPTSGRLTLYQDADMTYSGDTSGCSMTKVAGFENKTVNALAADPVDPDALYALASEYDANNIARSVVMRRDAQGTFSTIGPLKQVGPMDNVLGIDLLATKVGGATRLLTMYATWTGTDQSTYFLGLSEDGGKTWKEQSFPPTEAFSRLLAFDPTNPDRVLALEYKDDIDDTLMVSDDRGATFKPWHKVDTFSAVTFGADGRVFISATGNGSKPDLTGVFTAAKIGEPLTRLPKSEALDCLTYRPSDQKLFGCKVHQLGTIDATSGEFTKITTLEETRELVDCPGKDVKQMCEAELNGGSTWCCIGHFPFTEFCGGYDIKAGTKMCGKAARIYDCSIGRGPPGCEGGGGVVDGGSTTPDGGRSPTNDAGSKRDSGLGGADGGMSGNGDDDDEDDDDSDANANGDDGCSCRAAANLESGVPALIGLALVAFVNRRSRRRAA